MGRLAVSRKAFGASQASVAGMCPAGRSQRPLSYGHTQQDEENEHGKEAHVQDHAAPTQSPAR